MKQPIPPEAWLFDIEEAPVFTTITRRDELGGLTARKLPVPNKKALIAADGGDVLGVVGSGYRIFTNCEP